MAWPTKPLPPKTVTCLKFMDAAYHPWRRCKRARPAADPDPGRRLRPGGSAAGAARLLDQRGIAPDRIRVTLVNRDDWHSIRVRNYEPDLADLRVPLAKVLEPIGVDRVVGNVTAMDAANRQVVCEAAAGRQVLAYDRLVLALGSTLLRPPIPGLLEHGFDIDTYTAAERLQAHIAALATRPPATGRYTAIVVGGGLTGIECATEIIATLSAASAKAGGEAARVVLVDHAARVGCGMGDGACRSSRTRCRRWASRRGAACRLPP